MDKKKSLLLLSAVAIGTTVYNILKPVRSKVDVVENFDKKKYIGTWYEIARLDFFWEKNLTNVRADYSLDPDGSIAVVNSGYHRAKEKQVSRKGKALFVDTEQKGALKVSFFGPIYSAYNVVYIDDGYRYALVFGRNTDYMWILSREKTIPDDIKDKYLRYAEKSGYDIAKLVWTEQG